jgi:hypothetical protein
MAKRRVVFPQRINGSPLIIETPRGRADGKPACRLAGALTGIQKVVHYIILGIRLIMYGLPGTITAAGMGFFTSL